jgi:y4mF family transcriptional regulator
LINNDTMRNALSVHQKSVEQIRAGLQLPNLDAIAKQVKAVALLSKGFAEVTGARDLAQIAASAHPVRIDHDPLASASLAKQPENRQSFAAITSAHDLGQLIRKEREKRKLSQQAFADLVGVGRRFISELENGKATLEFEKVLQVASATGIDMLARRRR